MTILPIVERELRLASRRGTTWWVRFGAAGIALVAGMLVMLLMRREPPHQVSLAMFVCISALMNLHCLLVGVRTTADCLSAEKRDGTLGLLFLTDLRGYDIVLGKLAATSLNALYGVVAIVPVLTIPLLLGGVAPAEVMRNTLAALTTFFFSLSVGMLVSALFRREVAAAGWTAVTLLFFAGGMPLLWPLVTREVLGLSWNEMNKVAAPFLMPSPGYAAVASYDAIANEMKRSGIWMFWGSLATLHVLTWVFLALASVVVARVWQDRPRTTALRPDGGSSAPREFAGRAGLLDRSPFAWLASRRRLVTRLPWILLGVGSVIWLLGLARWDRDWAEPPVCILFGFLLHASFKNWVAAEATHRLSQDRPSGALELILATPISAQEIVGGQLRALRRIFAGPVAFIILADLVLMAVGLDRIHRFEAVLWVLTWIAGITFFLWDLHALAWTGMWHAMVCRSQNQAVSASWLRIGMLPWIGFGAILIGLALLDELGIRPFRGFDSDTIGVLILALWCVLSATANIVFTTRSRERLLTHFRQLATDRYDVGQRRPWWRRWLG